MSTVRTLAERVPPVLSAYAAAYLALSVGTLALFGTGAVVIDGVSRGLTGPAWALTGTIWTVCLILAACGLARGAKR